MNIYYKPLIFVTIITSLSYYNFQSFKKHEISKLLKLDTPYSVVRTDKNTLSETEINMAKIAWRYFENNYHKETGLVNSVDNYECATIWDITSYLVAIVSAHQINILDNATFNSRITKLLSTLGGLKLYNNEAFHKVYNIKTLETTNYSCIAAEIGYSTTDMGRLLIWLKILKNFYPEYSDNIDDIVLRFNFCNMIDSKGTLISPHIDNDDISITYLQEGRFGYEEYIAKGFQLWGFNTSMASQYKPFSVATIYGVDIFYDKRDFINSHSSNHVASEPFILDGIETGWSMVYMNDDKLQLSPSRLGFELAYKIYEVQKKDI